MGAAACGARPPRTAAAGGTSEEVPAKTQPDQSATDPVVHWSTWVGYIDVDEETGTPQVPEYEDPYLSAETSATADVAVVWKTDQAFPDWPTATVFSLVLADGRWIVVDALESTAVPDPLPAAAAE